MKTVAVKNIERAKSETIDALGKLGVATVHEAQGRTGYLKPSIRPVYPHAQIAGSAVTVLLQPGDNWMIHVAMELCKPGDVLIASCTAESDSGFFGDLLAESAMARGVRGLVIEGGVRDTASFQDMGFPVWSKAVSAQGTVKETLGAVNVPIVCAGQVVNPGDVVVADDDGVVIVERLDAEKVLKKGLERERKEAEKRALFAEGTLGLDIYNMRSRLQEKGLVYLENLEEYYRLKG
nr:4-carboxy-4-hydroxy-2-oxoadipate aldolase/oxaloacetate decarboxylase [uncultured Sphaerochaeta sp.]